MPFEKKTVFFRNIQKLRTLNTQSSLLPLAVILGIVGGLGAIAFHAGLHVATEYIQHDFAQLHLDASVAAFPRYLFFIIPALGGLFSGFIVYKFAPEAEGHGTDAMINTFHHRGGKVRKRVPFVKAISSIATIATGGSAGYEGPVAQIGSGMASIIGGLFRMPVRFRRIMLLAGTAAGLGAIFKAPLGGALTSVEILYKEDFESDAFMTSILSSVLAYTIYTAFAGSAPVFNVLPDFHFHNGWELLFYIVLGVCCSGLSFVYVKFFYKVRDFFRNLQIPNVYKPALGGLVVGFLFYLRPEIISGGWNYLSQAMDGSLALKFGPDLVSTLLIIALLKIVATAFTVGSGGSGGVFGPSLFIGGMFGGVVGHLLHGQFPQIVTQPEAYILVGMGAFFAGAANAPIAATIMVCELTGTYSLLAPLMISSVVHITLARKWSIYENQLPNKFHSPAHRHEMNIDVLQGVKIKDILHKPAAPVIVRPFDSLKDLEHHLAMYAEEDVFVVLNEQHLVGLLDVNIIKKAIFNDEVSPLVVVEDLMSKPHILPDDMNLHAALKRFLKLGANQLPVRNRRGEIITMLKHKDIIRAYDDSVKKSNRKRHKSL